MIVNRFPAGDEDGSADRDARGAGAARFLPAR